MPYSYQAQELRRCQGRRKDGSPCGNYAVWTDPRQLCGSHGGRVRHAHIREKTACPPCRCEAYPYPHRPASGLCCWPDAPHYRSMQRPGVHDASYKSTRRALARWGCRPVALLDSRLFGW
jgi:hypothetical protein